MDANTQHLDVAMINIQQLEVNFSLFGIKCQVFFSYLLLNTAAGKRITFIPKKDCTGH